MAAYCTPDSLAVYLGRDLTDAEETSAAGACLAATDFIDRYTGKSWQGITITGELQTVPARTEPWFGSIVRLDRRPVSSVTSVTARWLSVGTTPRVLVAGTGYELIDALNGLLLVNEWPGNVLTIAYVVGTTVPDAITLAANMIAASFAVGGATASGKARGIQKFKSGFTEVTFDPIDTATSVPPSALTLLQSYRSPVMFA